MQIFTDFAGFGWFFLAFFVVILILVMVSNRTGGSGRPQAWILAIWSLRFGAAVIILFLLFDPQLILSGKRGQHKRIAYVVDDSRSMTRAWDVDSIALRTSVSDIHRQLTGIGDVDVYAMGGTALDLDEPELFERPSSKLEDWNRVDPSRPQLKEYHTVFLITDAQLNAGTNPLDQSWTSKIPIYPILPAAARSNRQLILKEIETPPRSKQDTEIPIMIRIQQSGLTGEEITLTVRHKEQIIYSAEVALNSARSSHSVGLRFTDTGEKEIIVGLEHMVSGLVSQLPAKIHIEPDMETVMIYAPRLTPLVRALHASFPDTLYHWTLITETASGIQSPDDLPAGIPDYLFMIDPIELPVEHRQQIVAWLKAEDPPISIFFNQGRDPLDMDLLAVIGARQEQVAGGGLRSPFAGYELYEHPLYLSYSARTGRREMIEFTSLPPIQLSKYNLILDGVDLLNVMQTSVPIPVLQLHSQLPVAVFNGNGYWRWFFRPPAVNDFESFWKVLLEYLKNRREFRPLRVQMDAERATVGQANRGEAILQDLSGQAIVDAEVILTQRSEQMDDPVVLPLAVTGPGRYEFHAISHRAGKPKIHARAERFGQLWGQDSINIVFEDFEAELQTVGMNLPLLQALAVRSGGEVLTPEELDRLQLPEAMFELRWDWHFRGIRSLLLVMILVLLLAGEWAFRRQRGLL